MTRAQRNSRLVGSSAVHDTPILPDVLCPGLRVVFCGTAPAPFPPHEVHTTPALGTGSGASSPRPG